MANLGRSVTAGLAATVVLSTLMLMKSMMGLMPQLDVIAMLSGMMGAIDMPAAGWVAHFAIGTIGYGVAFALLAGRLPGSLTFQGVVVGMLGWLAMMIMVMPMAGAGLFGLDMGMVAPVMTLMLHVIFGAVLGWTYSRLTRTQSAGA